MVVIQPFNASPKVNSFFTCIPQSPKPEPSAPHSPDSPKLTAKLCKLLKIVKYSVNLLSIQLHLLQSVHPIYF